MPQRTRRLIEDRDRGCRYPGCSAARFVEVHHLDPWSEGGGTDYESNLCLCPFHHDGLHRGNFTIAGNPVQPAGLVFSNEHGLVIGPPEPREPCPDPRGDPDPYPAPTGDVLDLDWIELLADEPH